MTKISDFQKNIHIAGETAAILAAPILFVIGSDKRLPTRSRNFLYTLAAGTLAIDGFLLYLWMSKEK